MAHFARVDEHNVVQQVIVVNNETLENKEFPESEQIGRDFLSTLELPEGVWYQCSYNKNFRGNFPGKGYIYDSSKDVFISPKPYPSWTLNSKFLWEPPVPMPSDPNNLYEWNESAQKWQLDL